ncbi:cytochrome b/b6 domain-containing protein [Vibrio salinus]|uniref:cytochrome b/b6 domain-containing protein n=1 Tax=Vibrio salinus TaxID=2899784 RepID=UPI001E378595|nr:cytochrome b/b6 domain-containing protein [Vibrio salinus]MCE0495307.1 cytochrome b/b6 domain-containing protein [Vibrio salinus]
MDSFVWDKWVRFTHWSVALLFIINYAITKAGSEIHQWVGYAVGVLVLSRLIWGLLVHSPARLTNFLPSIPQAIQHIKQVIDERKDEHTGHNPAGAIMIWLLWSGLLALAVSGALMENWYAAPYWLEDFHETVANLTFFAALIHVSAVILMTKITGRSYLKSMKPIIKK